jgi:hypothetical protein
VKSGLNFSTSHVGGDAPLSPAAIDRLMDLRGVFSSRSSIG